MNEQLYSIAFSLLRGLSPVQKNMLYRKVGSAERIYTQRHDIPDATPRLKEALDDWSGVLSLARREMDYALSHNIRVLPLAETDYPQRLRECDDAPVVLYYTGNADLNRRYVMSIVGTRHATAYGQDMIRRFIADMRHLCPEVLIVSGLAYGIDTIAHRNALEQGFSTVGVLAHGLDDLYPSCHRATANAMVHQGGLLTEYPTHTNVGKKNFVQRNRIIAGMSDATLLVESAARGGGLITAGIARDYNRDVFAFPGRVGDIYSEGCNNLIAGSGAALITSAEDFLRAMLWDSDAKLRRAVKTGIERSIFPHLTADEQSVLAALSKENDQQINMLSINSGKPIGMLSSLLFELEMKGVVKPLAGGIYHLLT